MPNDRRSKVAEVAVEIIEVTARVRTHVGNKELILVRQMNTGGQFQRAVGSLAGRAQHDSGSPSEVQLGGDDVNVIGPTTTKVGAQIEPRRNNLI